jgi:C4-dicarboxylate transporter DctQ subunit
MSAEPGSSWLSPLGKVHDAVTRVGFLLAAVCLTVIVCAFTYEVCARYFFVAPTKWASSLVAYMLVYMVFLAMPELTRLRVHIFISIILDTMTVRNATLLQRVTYIVAAIACIVAAAFCIDATYKQYLGNVYTVNEWRVPKWVLSAAIPYGLLSTGIYYFRHVLSGAPYQSSEGM